MTAQAKIVAGLILAALLFTCIGLLIDKGRHIERAANEKENANVVAKAEDGDAKFRDCRNRGGVYNFDTKKCAGPAGGNGWLPSWLSR